MGFWARIRHSLAHRVSKPDWVCTCQIVGYIGRKDNDVYMMSPEQVEVIYRGK